MRIESDLQLVASAQFGLWPEERGAYDCHVYALEGSEGVVLVDSGGGLTVPEILGAVGGKVRAVVLTHVHPDHACGAAKIAAATGCEVYAPEMTVDAVRTGDALAIGLSEAQARGVYSLGVTIDAWPDARGYVEGQRLVFGDVALQPVHVRGHSRDSHCLLDEKGRLFAGDVLFYGAVLGVINRPDSGMGGYRADLKKLRGLGARALLPGHGMFTLQGAQRHIEKALEQVENGFLPRQVGQGDLIF